VKILIAAAKWLFMVSLPLLLLTASIAGAVNSSQLYKYGFEKYNVSQTTGLAEVELKKVVKGLINYFNSDEEFISLTILKDGKPLNLFNQREIIHLKDVKGLIRLDYRVFLGILLYALLYTGVCLWRRSWLRLARGLVWGSGLTLALMLALGLGTLLNFDQLFLRFHLISFANEFWKLDPTKDYLIMLFPRGFWYDATLFCALGTIISAVVLGGVGGVYLGRQKKH